MNMHATSRRKHAHRVLEHREVIALAVAVAVFACGLVAFDAALAGARAAQGQPPSGAVDARSTASDGTGDIRSAGAPEAPATADAAATADRDAGKDAVAERGVITLQDGNANSAGADLADDGESTRGAHSPNSATHPEDDPSSLEPKMDSEPESTDESPAASTKTAKAKSGKKSKGVETGAKKKSSASKKNGSGGFKSSGNTRAPAASTPTASGTQTTVKTKTIRHTAYKRTPVYRTVTHKKALYRSVTSADGTSVTWTLCPVCGKRHDKSYVEKVVDHYEETLCTACGKKHDHAYTETVRVK